MKQILSNKEIYLLANEILANNPFESDEVYLPIKVNYAFQKNAKTIKDLADLVESSRMKIGRHYGKFDEETQSYKIPNDKLEMAQDELNKLFDIEQSVDLFKVSLDDLQDLKLNSKQMQSLLFMIEA